MPPSSRPAARKHKTDGTWCWCRKEEAAYRYRNGQGRIVGRKRRILQDVGAHGRPKTFVWAKGSKQPDFYRLPELLSEIELGEDATVWLLTSEKDVELAGKLADLPGVAICLPNGERPIGDKTAKGYFTGFKGAICIVLDDDKTGWAAAAGTYRALSSAGAKNIFLWRSAAGKDFYRHITSGAGTEELIAVDPAELPAVDGSESDGDGFGDYGLDLVLGRIRELPENGERAEGGKTYFRCLTPDAHHRGDLNASMSVERGTEKPVVIVCTCDGGAGTGAKHARWFTEVLEALDLKPADLYKTTKKTEYRRNDEGNARRLLARHGDVMYWVKTGRRKDEGEWRIWNEVSRKWYRDVDGVVERWARQVSDEIVKEGKIALKQAAPGPNGGKSEAQRQAEELIKFGVLSANEGKIQSMLNSAKTLDEGRTVEPITFDSDPTLLAVTNGVVELTPSGVLFREAKREDFLSMTTRVPYIAGATGAGWDSYLDIFMPDLELRKHIQKLIGLSLLGSNPEKIIVFFQGETNSGKSTFLKMIGTVLGDYACTAPMSIFRGNFTEKPREDIAKIVNRRIVVTSEGDDGDLHADQIKRFTGDDIISFRQNFGSQVESAPWFTMCMAVNFAPTVKGLDKAFNNRLHVIPFEVSLANPSAAGGEMERSQEDQIAFLSWVIEGWNMYCEEGFARDLWPLKVLQQTDEYKNSMSEVSIFKAEMCVEGPEYSVPAIDLLRAYMAWSETDRPEGSVKTPFGRELGRLGFPAKKVWVDGKTATLRMGIRLRSSHTVG